MFSWLNLNAVEILRYGITIIKKFKNRITNWPG